tara:strand:+ start:3147 stop:3398 length:252 start_codon:yes stop_codon:yes gene_type:complete
MKSTNPKNEYIPLNINLSVRRDTIRLLTEMANDMGISLDEVLSFLAEDSVLDLEIDEALNEINIPNKCSLIDLKNIIKNRKLF